MKIAVDAMGGDFAPEQIVFGAVRAARKYQCEIVLVGD
ncbi:MAG: phosphate acyltransferase, partial [Selenomonadaceae bacterium]|nr:phosphate acyltransferase [Selenomonadaceae bacterium]